MKKEDKYIHRWLLALQVCQCALGSAMAYFTPFYRQGMIDLPNPLPDDRSFYPITEFSFRIAFMLPFVPILGLILLFVLPYAKRLPVGISSSILFLALLLVTLFGLMYPWVSWGGVYWN